MILVFYAAQKHLKNSTSTKQNITSFPLRGKLDNLRNRFWFQATMTTPDILSALTKFTRGLQEVQAEIAGLGKCTTLMQFYSVYAKTLWDPEKQIETFNTLCRYGGDLDLLDLLLSDMNLDPSDLDNYAIRIACEHGHLSVVDRLLQDSRVDPSASNNHAIRFASENGHHWVVDRLLQDSRVDPSAGDNHAILWASEKGHIDIVNRLLQDDRVDPSVNNNLPLRLACLKGYLEIVKLLLNNSRVWSTYSAENMCKLASGRGHMAIVEFLSQS